MDTVLKAGVATIVARITLLILMRNVGAQVDVERIGRQEALCDAAGGQVEVVDVVARRLLKIGRASCRVGVCPYVSLVEVAVLLQQHTNNATYHVLLTHIK